MISILETVYGMLLGSIPLVMLTIFAIVLKPQPFVFVCTEHLKCLTKIFGIGLNIMFAIAISAALEM